MHIQIVAKRNGTDDYFLYVVKWIGGIELLRFEVPAMKWSEQGMAKQQRISTFSLDEFLAIIKLLWACMSATKGYKRWMIDCIRAIQLIKLNWQTRIGMGEAMHTAICVALLYQLQSQMMHYFVASQWKHNIILETVGDYQNVLLNINVDGLCKISDWKILALSFQFIRLLICSPKSIRLWWNLFRSIRMFTRK